ncbi:MAG: molybdenum cofactor biosynthesis protein MoaE [Candidatus Bathyarchaeia archaeon]
MDVIGLHKKGEVDLNQIMGDLSQLPNYHEAGAVGCFVGVVREDPVRESEAKVVRLEYEAYTDVALKRMQEIRDAIKRRPGVIEVSIHHVIDTLKVGEPSLFVAVLGKHRQDVFPALSETVERVKKEVPIWKKEFTTKESYWVSNEPRQNH